MAAAPDLHIDLDLEFDCDADDVADEGKTLHGDIGELLAVRPVRVLALPQARHGQASGGDALTEWLRAKNWAAD